MLTDNNHDNDDSLFKKKYTFASKKKKIKHAYNISVKNGDIRES